MRTLTEGSQGGADFTGLREKAFLSHSTKEGDHLLVTDLSLQVVQKYSVLKSPGLGSFLLTTLSRQDSQFLLDPVLIQSTWETPAVILVRRHPHSVEETASIFLILATGSVWLEVAWSMLIWDCVWTGVSWTSEKNGSLGSFLIPTALSCS